MYFYILLDSSLSDLFKYVYNFNINHVGIMVINKHYKTSSKSLFSVYDYFPKGLSNIKVEDLNRALTKLSNDIEKHILIRVKIIFTHIVSDFKSAI